MKKKYIVGILSLMLTSTLVWSGDIMLITKSAEEQAAAEGKSVIVTIKKEGDSDISMEMVWCPPGIYTMGSPDSELGRGDDEAPCNVIIEFCSGFWISKYEVTQAQYKAVMGYNPSYFSGDDRPVEEVSWYDAMEFCARLTAIERAACRLPEGGKYTLPTEVQWEYACR
ncbi:MAG: formylglycine-generating enzyme family protein, partial [Verrucomicrobia bacterium]|nr:formylglycine-generating enzyme family protein [Verrucomicrobiota bacterium]